MTNPKVLIVGGGIMGVSSALALHQRGFQVTVLERSLPPHPEASSTDISKIVRGDYGADEFYTDFMETAWQGWARLEAEFGEQFVHTAGILMMSYQPMQAGGFEYDSFERMSARNYPLTRLSPDILREKFPFFAEAGFQDGYFNAKAGWAPSGHVLARLTQISQQIGIRFVSEGFAQLLENDARVVGALTQSGQRLYADWVILSMGAWTPHYVPALQGLVKSVGQPVLHFRVHDPAAKQIPVWAADITQTGWYGFPATADGLFKVGNHGPGLPWQVGDPLVVPPQVVEVFRNFIERSFPALRGAPVANTRLCLYCDSFDGNFWIDHHPAQPGLIVAAGDSGHAFKFVPVIGEVIADVLQGRQNQFAPRFAWRTFAPNQKELLRAQGNTLLNEK